MSDPKIHRKIIVNFIVAICVLLGIVFLVPKLLRFFMPFVIGWIIAMIANPLVRFMEKRIKIVRKHGSVIIIIIVLGTVVGLLYLVVSVLIHESVQLINDLPSIYEALEEQIKNVTESLGGIYNILPRGVKNFADSLSDNIGVYLSNAMADMKTPSISDAGAVAKNAAEFLFMSIITILSAYFFIAEKDNLSGIVRKYAPESIMKQYDMIVANFKKAVGGYFKAQFKIMLIITVILFIGFEFMDVKYSFLLALGTAFLDLLPIFGTGAVIWPWAVVEAITGSYGRVIGLLIIYLVCQVVKQLLQPKMVGDSIGISPLQTLVFMFIGYRLGGLFGLIIGIPAGMIIVNFYRSGMFDRLIKGFKILAHDLAEYIRF